ncbi:hypothetical protein CLV58_103254 [Spirosoma oryzae]|uniref:YD repeat-containing protein n=1 Tax=Spirosoma oryzae TaxID=1469603 RepID=A0A2T0TF43_9BACT|nr:hypothetical protein [Spirosoma oryzae]PRY44285.1 hypothetical protein CLV58_103254 [Spirosoma oryzae]
MPIRLSTVAIVLFFGLQGLWGCQPSDPVATGIPVDSTPEVNSYACKFYKKSIKMSGVGEFGESTGASEDFSIVSFFDTVYTRASVVNSYKHTFDSQKFLTKRTASNYHQLISSNPINGQSEIIYQYTAGKLTSAITSSTVSTGTVYTSSQRYTYDANGQVTQYVSTGTNGATDTQTFEGGILRSYRIVDGQGDVHDRTPYINSQGLVTQVDFTKGVYFSRFAYDPAGNPIRVEEWRQGKLDAYTTNEYGAKSNQKSATFAHKGHPVLPDAFWSGANHMVKSTYYSSASGYSQPIKRSVSDYAYTFDERGLVAKCIKTTRWFSLTGSVYQTDTTEEVYGYRPCQ